jgi:N-acetylmuramoyl-L-alanine amidase
VTASYWNLQWAKAAAFALAALWASAPASAATATAVRVAEHEDHTRFVLEMSSKADYRVFYLADPNRIVVELPEMGWQLPGNAGKSGAGLVTGYRYGVFRKGKSRIVLDLKSPAKVLADFSMEAENGKPARLVLDIAPTDADNFAAIAGWPDDASRADPEPPVNEAVESQPVQSHDGKLIVAIDAGHGGVDPGASGVSGAIEKEITLNAAHALKAALESRGRYDVVLIRDGDKFVTLKDRVRAGRAAKADLFISLHADTVSDSSVHGASVYTLSEKASDGVAAELEQSENSADLISGVDLARSDDVSSLLIDLAQRETKNRSSTFAQMLIPKLAAVQGVVKQNPHRFAGFRVLKAPDVPSVLIELGFLSNRDDEARLTSKAWRREAAEAIAGSVDAYFNRMASVADARH